ncbi:MAG: hypothetical protein ABIY70_22390 [Capsulimonas sp.]|uniref:hypothetical protein n=1 Tax=Capsulimonas sp. TaxID=2494211 RepID=UPI003266C598
MTQHSVWGKLLSRLSGEIPADTLEAYRRASRPVYELLDQIETRRLECKAEGLTPWTVLPAMQAEMLCAWNAFVLQHLGDRFLQADYEANPATVGFVPPITADQILAFYGQVAGWVGMAQEAHSNPNYRLSVAVPADLPPWSEVEPCPNAHLHAMLEAMRAVREHAQAAMVFLPDVSKLTDPKQQSQGYYMQQLLAASVSKAGYAEDLHGVNPTQEVHERVEPFIKEAIEGFYRLGQFIAMPQLVDLVTQKPAVSPPSLPQTKRPYLPGQVGFDPWILTDPSSRDRFKADPKARLAIQELWKLDPNPEKTVMIQQEIDEAFARGDLKYTTDNHGARLGHFFCCPWGPVYTVTRPVTLGGMRLSTMQQFVYDVTAEGVNLGATFQRHIKVGVFNPTTEFEYGDPNEPPDH